MSYSSIYSDVRLPVIYLQFVRFVGVGLVATMIHYGVLVLLVQMFGIEPIAASVIGFVLAAIVNYLLNYHLTFKSRANHASASTRFVLVALVGLSINTLTMSLLIQVMSTPYLIAQVSATALVLVWNFLCNRAWTF